MWVQVLFLASIFSLVTLTGCSVKEDRESCPSLLVLNIDDVVSYADISAKVEEGTTVDGKVVVSVSGKKGWTAGDILEADTLPFTERIEVKRQADLCVDVVWPGDSGYDSGLKIEHGRDCPRVWMWSEKVDSRRDIVERDVHLHKNYCVVTLNVTGNGGVKEGLLNYAVAGNVCGYMPGGEPLAGDFLSTLEEDADGNFVAVLPRQKDASLMLNVVRKGAVLRQFAVGEYIEESGYDWSAPDLRDISMEINYTAMDVTFSIDDWSKTVSFEVVI